ncbi:hypothetical protein V1512DRAFT_267580 [Lipomyces arxii]|uniref:uncharacterized protein n=1 Tax=Lipomyces arxii TaxID=56418 RepID=UPI0034CE341F
MDSSYAHELAAAYPELDLADNSVNIDVFGHDPNLFHETPLFSQDTGQDDPQRPRQLLPLPLSESYGQLLMHTDLPSEPEVQPSTTVTSARVTEWPNQNMMPYVFHDDSSAPPTPPNIPLNVPNQYSTSVLPSSTAADESITTTHAQPISSSTLSYITSITQNTPDLQHVLSPYGKVLFVSPSVSPMLGYSVAEFTGKFLAEYVVAEDCENFTKELNHAATDSLSDSSKFSIFCRFKRKDTTTILVEVVGRAQFGPSDSNSPNGGSNGNSNGKSKDHQTVKCFFLIARPYRTKNSVLIDSFLEHKFENIRLRNMVEALRNAAEPGTVSPSSIRTGLGSELYTGSASADRLLGRRNSDTLNAGVFKSVSSPSSVESTASSSDQQYGAYSLSHVSPTRSQNKAGLDIDTRAAKKSKLGDDKEYVCKECGTLDSPEWRKGPEGPKTLCNACGLRWSKSLKKKVQPVTTKYVIG